MNVTSTPVSSTTSKKRELTSPEDLSELKKNRLLSESSKSDISDISNLSIMADQDVQANVEPAVTNIPPSGTSSQNVITLKDTDIQTIAGILRETFAPQLTEMVNTIVSGVVEGLNLTIQSLQKENRGLKARVELLEAKVDAAEQYSRRNCLRIAGVPENQSENTDVYVIDLTRAIDAEVTLDDIERSHRVGKRRDSGRPRDIIVKFSSYRTRRKVYGARTKTKDNGYRGVYINEDLTKLRNVLLMKARNMVKTKHIHSAWSSDGTILVRDLADNKHRIISENDLALFGPVPKLRGEQSTTDSQGILATVGHQNSLMDH